MTPALIGSDMFAMGPDLYAGTNVFANERGYMRAAPMPAQPFLASRQVVEPTTPSSR